MKTEVLDTESFDYFLIVDLESTCCNNGSISKGEHEIIEIGAVMVDAITLKEIDSFNTFVKPIKHSKLTQFCTTLTTITQKNVDSAPLFPDAAKLFERWLNNYNNYLFCSWGNYDKNHLQSDSLFYKIKNPVTGPHVNIKKRFSKQQKVKAMGMKWALELVNEPLIGNHHRGIDDVRNMVKLLPYVFGHKYL